MRLLFVHGRGQGGADSGKLKDLWLATLQKGFEAADIPYPNPLDADFPYYGDALDARVAKSRLPLPKDITPKGDAESTPYEEFVRSSLKEMQLSASISDAEVAVEAGPIPATEKGIANWRLTQAIARLIDKHFPNVTSYTIESFLRDVFLYVSDRNVAREINAIVAAELTAEPTIVIAHSLGTVVAYKVLLEQAARVSLRRFITVGSPLGIRTIGSQLGVIRYPPADQIWYNGYDKGDIVALNPLKRPFFVTNPEITNYSRVRNTTDNQHGIIGYLNDPTIARQVAEALSP
jgi:hypothetical protein